MLVESRRLVGLEEPLGLTAAAPADILQEVEVGVLHGDGEERRGSEMKDQSNLI